MPFTGGLGTSDSGLSNVGLGAAPGHAATDRSLQLKANIYGKSTQSLQLKARVHVPMATLQMQARIRGVESFQAKAKIVGFLQSALEVDFNVLVNQQSRLTVQYNVGDKLRSYRSLQMKASILLPRQSRLTIDYSVCWNGPILPVIRPTQRTSIRTVQSLLMKATIRRRS